MGKSRNLVAQQHTALVDGIATAGRTIEDRAISPRDLMGFFHLPQESQQRLPT